MKLAILPEPLAEKARMDEPQTLHQKRPYAVK